MSYNSSEDIYLTCSDCAASYSPLQLRADGLWLMDMRPAQPG